MPMCHGQNFDCISIRGDGHQSIRRDSSANYGLDDPRYMNAIDHGIFQQI